MCECIKSGNLFSCPHGTLRLPYGVRRQVYSLPVQPPRFIPTTSHSAHCGRLGMEHHVGYYLCWNQQ
ncbi:UNVERIFIED_CONTAM: hypothetical protein NCL1_30763 [Trichonephila clavipes]